MTGKEELTESRASGQAIHEEEIPLDPQRPIVDPHLHLWDFTRRFWETMYPAGTQPPPRFLLPEVLETIDRSGHNITHTVFIECHVMYRADGPAELRPVGETEFVNGIAAMSASGNYGPCRVAAAIVGAANLRLGDRVKGVLEAQIAAGNGRFRGIRTGTAYADVKLLGLEPDKSAKGLMMDGAFRQGVAALEPLGLSMDVWCMYSQIPDLADLAAGFPGTHFILNHIGGPLNFGPYANREKEIFENWTKGIIDIARRPNVSVKLGGLGIDMSVPIGPHCGYELSATLAAKWRPYIETCIAAFRPERCMFESNFPPDKSSCTYGALWNAFKLIVAEYSQAEKNALFSDTAKRIYRLNTAALSTYP